MTAKQLRDIFEQCGIPDDARVMSDSDWECWATDVEQIFYNSDSHIAVLTQGPPYDDAYEAAPWKRCLEKI